MFPVGGKPEGGGGEGRGGEGRGGGEGSHPRSILSMFRKSENRTAQRRRYIHVASQVKKFHEICVYARDKRDRITRGIFLASRARWQINT
jgi:hypothetical protein